MKVCSKGAMKIKAGFNEAKSKPPELLRGCGRVAAATGRQALRCVGADRKLTIWGCGGILGLGYAVSPRLARYSRGLSEPREILMRFSLYQWMYSSTVSMNCSMVVACQFRG